MNSKITELYCQPQQDEEKCKNYRKIVDDYRKGTIRPDLKREIKSLVEKVIKSDKSCKLENFSDLNKDYQNNSDYQRVQDIQRGYLINAGEIFVLFLLSFLMFSLREFVQQMGSSIAGGGYSVYSISSMYHASPLAGVAEGLKQKWQDFAGGKLESLGSWATHLPDRLAGGTANLLGRIPRVGGVLKHAIDAPRKLVNATIEATKFVTSPENDIDKLEEKIYRAFGVDKEDITHRRIGKYLDYYKGYVGSHLGYTIEDAMKFTWEHGLDSIGVSHRTGEKDGYQGNLLCRAKSHRRDFLEKLHDYTIGRKREPEKDKLDQPLKENKSDQSNELARELGTEKYTNTPEAIEKRAERARRKKERDQEGENYDTSLLFGEDTEHGDGNIKLNDYDDILNARRARVDLLLDNTLDNNIDLTKLNKALSEKFVDNHSLLSEFDKEDKEIAQERLKVFNILDNLDNLANIKSEDLLEVSLLLSDLSFVERNVVLNTDQNSDLVGFKNLFVEKKASGEEYSDEECKSFLDNIDKINTIIKLELESRIEGINHDERNDYGGLQDEIGQAINAVGKSEKNNG
ncbi:uncharacterized protein NPIL_596251 [Nephila pilipes]|uniref:Uncharacterized protein n=1 Tax=Nephila pilipes TaxID=299642 RepID=A0A8X6TAA1_NEPPI|nr:uncharacterized protein NPIL_596251 [Nephila pilipes]